MEACAAGRPVFLHEPKGGAPEKFRPLHQRLSGLGCLKPLGSPWFEVEGPPPNPAFAIAAAIRKLLAKKNDGYDEKPVASLRPAS